MESLLAVDKFTRIAFPNQSRSYHVRQFDFAIITFGSAVFERGSISNGHDRMNQLDMSHCGKRTRRVMATCDVGDNVNRLLGFKRFVSNF